MKPRKQHMLFERPAGPTMYWAPALTFYDLREMSAVFRVTMKILTTALGGTR